MLVFLIVAGISYAAYLFLGATHMSDAAGLHLTKSFQLAASDVKGDLYSNDARGIKDWMVYSDKNDLFEIKYPNNWKLQEGKESVTLKLFQANNDPRANALQMSIVVGAQSMLEPSFKEFLSQRSIVWDGEWKESTVNDRAYLETGCIKMDGGLTKEIMLWGDKKKGKVIFLEATYFQEKHEAAKSLFHKIASEFVIK